MTECNLTAEEWVHASAIWRYCAIDMPVMPADFVLALGCHDERVAERAADLVLEGIAPRLVLAGGFGKITKSQGKIPEAERFAEIALGKGVPEDRILIENKSSNTGENIHNARRLLSGEKPARAVIVTKPYAIRRAWASARKQWPDVKWRATGQRVAFEDYPNERVPLDRTVSLMVGEIVRLRLYARRGFLVPQRVPKRVWESAETLMERGYSHYAASAE
jgi:hypothetical protein